MLSLSLKVNRSNQEQAFAMPKTTHQLGGFVLLHIHYSYLIDVIIMRLYCWRWPRSLWTRFLAL